MSEKIFTSTALIVVFVLFLLDASFASHVQPWENTILAAVTAHEVEFCQHILPTKIETLEGPHPKGIDGTRFLSQLATRNFPFG